MSTRKPHKDDEEHILVALAKVLAAVGFMALTIWYVTHSPPTKAQVFDESQIPTITNSKAADMTGWRIKLRNNAATGDPEDKAITELTEDLTPASNDWVITGLNADGELKKSQIGNLPITGEATTASDTATIDLTETGDDISGIVVADSIGAAQLDAATDASLALADSALQSIAADSITTAELDDGADTPLVGEWLQVATGGLELVYRTDAEARADLDLEVGTDVQGWSAILDATTASFLIADETKLDGIETGADVTDTTNVTSSGALMDSEVTNLAQVKAFDTTDYATSAQGATADAALPTAGGTMTGQIVADNLGVEFEDSDTNPSCAAGNYSVFADLSETTLKKCVNGTITDLDTAGGTVDPTSDFSPIGNAGEQLTVNEAETAMEFALASKYLSVRKGSAGTITAGTPVYISGYNVGQSSIEVEEADADNSAAMPAVGLAFDSITNAANSRVITIGGTEGLVDTSAWTVGDAVYVSATVGTLTNVKPTGTAAIQKVGTVARSNASSGQLTVVGAGRSNDIPNIANTKIWIGDASGVPQEFALSGDITMTAGGVTTIGAGLVGADELDAATDASLALADTALQSIAADSITTAELDDGADTPLVGEWLQVATGGLEVQYRTDTEAISDLGIDADITTTTIGATATLTGSNTGDQNLADTVAEITDLDNDAATFSLPASTTITPAGASVIDDATVSIMRATLGVDTGGTNLPLAGGTMTGQIVADNLGIEFEDSDTNPTCAAGNYSIYADLSETELKKCVNGVATVLSSGGGASQLTDLSDVGTAAVTNRFALMADGTDYDGRALTIADISDASSNGAIGVSAYVNTNEALVAGVAETVTDWTEQFDVGGDFNASTGVFTAPVAGKYVQCATLQYLVGATGDRIRTTLEVSGQTNKYSQEVSPNGTTQSVTACNVWDLSASDTLSVQATNVDSADTLQSGEALSFMSIMPMGGTWQLPTSYSDVDVSAYLTSNEAVAAGVAETLDTFTEEWDTGGDFNASTGVFTAPTAGKYVVSGKVTFDGTADNDRVILTVDRSAGTDVSTYHQAHSGYFHAVPFNVVLDLAADETVSLQVQNVDSADTVLSGALHTNFQVRSTVGTMVDVLTTDVGVSAYLDTNEAIAATTAETIIFGTEDWDYGADYNASTGVFTAPVSGDYRVSGLLRYSATGLGDQEQIQARVLKEGTTIEGIYYGMTSGATENHSVPFNTVVNLSTGETVEIQAYSDATQTVVGTAGHSFLNITYEGNGVVVNNLLDDDTMATANSTQAASAESVKAYVDNSDRKYMYQITAEENAAMAASTYEWAYGNGAAMSVNGGVMIHEPSGESCSVVAMGTRSGNATGTWTVELVLNGTPQGASANVAVSSAYGALNSAFTPIALADGDLVNFRTQAVTSSPANQNTATMWIECTY